MREKELRLALVCYGGISLAVYMHGITKEIWRLSRASQAFRAGETPAGGTQGVYRDLFEEIAVDAELKLRVLVDIVAGASAGGINGVFLAQAISSGQSLEPLTDLWLDGADVEALIDPTQRPQHGFTKAWALPIAWAAAKRGGGDVDELVEAGARDEVKAKLSHFVRSRWFEPPFGGERFTAKLMDALEAMAAAPRGPRLLPPGQPLDLFVTVTDFGGHPERIPLHSPPEVTETEHRLVVTFSDHGAGIDSLADPAELAFAARATSSFPGAFPPFMVGELDRVLAARDRAWPTRDAFLERVLPRQFAAQAADAAVLIDGSVLNNAPFRPAIEALRERPARREIDRRFVYVDPFPGFKFALGKHGPERPGFFQTIIGSVSELPRKQPIRDNLEEIAQRSDRIERMREVMGNMRPEIDKAIEQLFGFTLFLDSPNPARLASWRSKAQSAAAKASGLGYVAYGHLKIAGIVESITQLLFAAGGEPGPQRWTRIRAAITDAARERGYSDLAVFAGGASPATIEFMRNFDLGFRIRRLRLLARRIGEIAYDASARAMALREAVYDSLAAYLEKKRTGAHVHLRERVRALHGDAGDLLDALAGSLDLKRLDDETDARLAEAIGALDKDARRPVLLAYLGFPFLDIATLPMLQGEGVDEFDPIKVDRISPDDATAIRSGGAQATLKGIQFHTFGAFFSRAYRENDYLWGRLHGAERAIDITLSTLDGVTLKPGRAAALKRRAFCAILDEEEPRLTAIGPLIASLRKEIG